MNTPILEITQQSYAAFRATRCGFPAQLGRMTLQQAGYAMCERHRERLSMLRGDSLSLARAVAVVALWKRWTWPDSFPTLIHAEGFIHALSNPNG